MDPTNLQVNRPGRLQHLQVYRPARLHPHHFLQPGFVQAGLGGVESQQPHLLGLRDQYLHLGDIQSQMWYLHQSSVVSVGHT